jgi:hypothetical protein
VSVKPVPSVTHHTVELPWQARRASNRQRRTAMNRERDCMLGAIEAEIVTRQGGALSAIERSLVMAYVGCAMALSDLDRRLLRGTPIDHTDYSRLMSSLIKLARQLGTPRPGRITDKAEAAGVVSLSSYLASKGGGENQLPEKAGDPEDEADA